MNRLWVLLEYKTRLNRENMFILLGLVLVFIMLVSLTTYIFISNVQRDEIIMKYQAEQVYSNFLMQLRQNPMAVETLFKESPLLGIAVYDQAGKIMTTQFTIGDVPREIDVSPGSMLASGEMIYNDADNTISFVRQARLTLSLPIIGFTQSILDEEAMIRLPDSLYIKMDGKMYRDQYIASITLFSVVIFLILMAEVGIWFLYKRNELYRRRLAEQGQLARLGEAARTLTHEIKNPLSAITLQNAYLRKTLPPQYVGELRVIEEEIGRLNHLTGRISDFLRNPQGEPERISVVPFVRELLAKFEHSITFADQSVSSCTVVIDRERFRSIIENILLNALESCTDTKRDPQVSVEISCGSRHVIITIADRGDGLPQGDGKKLFDPFYTTKIHGSGIGLAISLRFIEAARGTLRITPREGGGTQAVIKLPGGTG